MRFGDNQPDLDELIKNLIIESVRHANDTAPRSTQRELGPSQISHQCDRNLVYQLVHGPGKSRYDPWPAVVGTAIHAYLEKAVPEYGRLHNIEVAAEQKVTVGPGVIGHSDLYVYRTVVDYKGTSSTRLNQYLKAGKPPANYRTQTHLYGLGFEATGKPVENVAIVFLPRDGQLRNMYVWVEEYDQDVARAALDRYLGLRSRVAKSDFTDPTIWGRISATPGDHCGFCPWYQVGKAADSEGCPGRQE